MSCLIDVVLVVIYFMLWCYTGCCPRLADGS